MTAKKRCCGNCIYYMTDEDVDGSFTDFHHDRNKDEGFCIVQDLFYTVKNEDDSCADWICDNE